MTPEKIIKIYNNSPFEQINNMDFLFHTQEAGMFYVCTQPV